MKANDKDKAPLAAAFGLCALSGALVATVLTSLAWWLLG